MKEKAIHLCAVSEKNKMVNLIVEYDNYILIYSRVKVKKKR
jgi:hypothetical protein